MKKKILFLICAVTVVFCACGKGEAKKVDDAINNWEKHSVMINDEVITLDCDMSTYLDAMGETFDEGKDLMIESGDRSSYTLLSDGEIAIGHFGIYNDSENEKNIMDCRVTVIGQYTGLLENGAEPIIFPGGLEVGRKITTEDIVKLFGEPTSLEIVSSSTTILTYLKEESETDNYVNFTIFVRDDEITDLLLGAYQK